MSKEERRDRLEVEAQNSFDQGNFQDYARCVRELETIAREEES